MIEAITTLSKESSKATYFFLIFAIIYPVVDLAHSSPIFKESTSFVIFLLFALLSCKFYSWTIKKYNLHKNIHRFLLWIFTWFLFCFSAACLSGFFYKLI